MGSISGLTGISGTFASDWSCRQECGLVMFRIGLYLQLVLTFLLKLVQEEKVFLGLYPFLRT